MARKLTKSGLVTITEFSRMIGVSQSAVSQAIQNCRLVVYSSSGRRVLPGYAGRKWLKPAEAARHWDESRIRFDDDYLLGAD